MISLKGKDILHGNQFSKKDIDGIIKIASHFEKELKKKDSLTLLKGKILATLFFEPILMGLLRSHPILRRNSRKRTL